MAIGEVEHTVAAWSFGDLLLEWHRYPPGRRGTVPLHAHDDYQLCLSLDFPGEYRYRGASHPVPVGSISVIHPGEMHSARDPDDRLIATTFKVIYAKPELFAAAAADLNGRTAPLPFFANPVIRDATLAAQFRHLYQASAIGASRLELDTHLISVLTRLLRAHASEPPAVRPAAVDHHAVRMAQDYLANHYCEDVSLAQLADLTELSPFHLNRIFRSAVGLPPHAFQLAMRVERAKRMLLDGYSVARVATAVGFFDQSHFTRHFKRYVGVSPGRYLLGARTYKTASAEFGNPGAKG